MTVNQFIQALREESSRLMDDDVPEAEGAEVNRDTFDYWVERSIAEALERFVK